MSYVVPPLISNQENLGPSCGRKQIIKTLFQIVHGIELKIVLGIIVQDSAWYITDEITQNITQSNFCFGNKQKDPSPVMLEHP